jgi:hypothetical protein
LHSIFANLGVPHDLLRAPLPPGGPRTLLKYVRGASRCRARRPAVARRDHLYN